MIYGLYLSAAGLQAQQARQEVISNNLANAQTTGFKRDLAIMRARANAVDEDPSVAGYRLPIFDKQGGGVFPVNGGIDLSPGSLDKTGNQTDVAFTGPGFFTVQGDKPGQKLLTRDGRFLLNNDGFLVTGDNRAVLNGDGEPIKLNPALKVTIQPDGRITQSDGTGASTGVQMGVVDVSDPRKLRKVGSNLLTVTSPDSLTSLPANSKLQQGYLEASGVEPIVEMVNMMEGQRAFEANARMITFQDTTLQQLNTIGRVA